MKTVLITGISRGIGRATSGLFLTKDWHVIGTSTSGKANISNPNLEIYKLDMLDGESIRNFSGKVINSRSKIDVLINNAGISLDTGESIDHDALIKTLQVNLIGLIDLTEMLLNHINNGGHIINVSSTVGSITAYTTPYAPSYAISKVALNMYTRILAGRLRNRKITVSSIHPGWVKTDMGGLMAPREPSSAALDIYSLATSSVESGFFWYGGKKTNW
jgi:NAD(P)-dependent dehydrogenase (short-subunit alcohol dehydrogenase family)